MGGGGGGCLANLRYLRSFLRYLSNLAPQTKFLNAFGKEITIFLRKMLRKTFKITKFHLRGSCLFNVTKISLITSITNLTSLHFFVERLGTLTKTLIVT